MEIGADKEGILDETPHLAGCSVLEGESGQGVAKTLDTTSDTTESATLRNSGQPPAKKSA
jgi:hypothetical protein